MGDKRLCVSVIGSGSLAVDDVEKLPTLPHQSIYVEKAEFRDVMSINMVAVALGLSVRQLRRMIESGAFPESIISKGQNQFWLRHTVRTWKKSQLRISRKRGSPSTGMRSRWKNENQIELEEEREFRLKATETQKLTTDVRQMRGLMELDPVEFARQNPALKKWMKEKGML